MERGKNWEKADIFFFAKIFLYCPKVFFFNKAIFENLHEMILKSKAFISICGVEESKISSYILGQKYKSSWNGRIFNFDKWIFRRQ